MSRRLLYFCARGCGQNLDPSWRFCPACGRSFGRIPGPALTVTQARRARTGNVSVRRAPAVPKKEPR